MYYIEAIGASGGQGFGGLGGLGAFISGEFSLSEGETLSILIVRMVRAI